MSFAERADRGWRDVVVAQHVESSTRLDTQRAGVSASADPSFIPGINDGGVEMLLTVAGADAASRIEETLADWRPC